MNETIEKEKRRKDKDVFMLCLSTKEGDQIKTTCLASNFAYADIPIAKNAITNNLTKLFVESAPKVPSALKSVDKNADLSFIKTVNPPDEDSVPESEGG